MSKRFIYPQQHGERKKAKLDVTISDHNFPLSQNSPIKKDNQETWGDDNDDEILLLASQACEEVYNNDNSCLPDYSMCMQPRSTSTQICDPLPGTSKSTFMFKTPSTCMPNAVSTHLRNKCNTISSPLPGISSKVSTKINDYDNPSEDLLGYKVYKGQDSDQIYRQLLQLQEDNAKLKSENGKLLEKCVTKEGEASILRTQLKTCQLAVDNARLEKVKAQEKIQAEWTDKLTSANSQIHDLRTQLDFKNLEIISVKEKCKKLENNKLRLTQVTVGSNDITVSHRNNNVIIANDMSFQSTKRAKMVSNSVQTDNKAHFLKLNRSFKKESSRLSDILPTILETSSEQHFNILEYNEKLQRQTDFLQNKCRIFSTFHRLPSTAVVKEISKNKVSMSNIYEDLTYIAADKVENLKEKYFNIFKTVIIVLKEIETELATISRRMTTAFQKEMDEKYIESTSSYLCVDIKDLLQASNLYKEEQGILARRMTAMLVYILESPKAVDILNSFAENNKNSNQFIEVISRICNLIDGTSCAILYSGLLLSITIFIEISLKYIAKCDDKVLEILKNVIASRPMPFVACQVLAVLNMVHMESFRSTYCPGSSLGNLRLDYDQGVLLYKKDSCYLQVLLKQIEASLKCMEKQTLFRQTIITTRYLIGIYSNINSANITEVRERSRCDCQLVLLQVIVYALRICAVMLKDNKSDVTSTINQELTAVCRSGLQVLYQCTLRDVEFTSQLSYNEGHLIEFCEILKCYEHSELYGNMLTEIASTFQSSPEDMPSSFHRQAWLNSFKKFSLAD